jgi:hypothetical protein
VLLDSYFTRNYVDGDGEKYNLRARQFCPNVHTTAVRVTAIAAPFAAETATASLLLRRHRDNPAHATLAAGGVHLCVNEAKSVATLKMLAQKLSSRNLRSERLRACIVEVSWSRSLGCPARDR